MMDQEQERGWSERDIDKLIRNWIVSNLEIRTDGETVSIGYMRDHWLSGTREFEEISSCRIPTPIHSDNIRFGG